MHRNPDRLGIADEEDLSMVKLRYHRYPMPLFADWSGNFAGDVWPFLKDAMEYWQRKSYKITSVGAK